MLIVRNNIIPFKGFKMVNLFGILFVKKHAILKDTDINHEAIHSEQMKELLFIPYYIIYVLEWIVRFIGEGLGKDPYKSLSFEKEAYDNQTNSEYIKTRKHYAMWRRK